MNLDWRYSVLFLALAAAACGSGSEQSDTSPSLVYMEYTRIDSSRVVRVAADGTHRKVLWNGGQEILTSLYPSPDGRSVLFAYSGQWLLVPTDSGAAAPFTSPTSGTYVSGQPVWAPDGSAIAWLMGDSQEPYGLRLGVAPPGSATAQLITADSLYVWSFSWSPDARQLVICARTSDQAPMRLYVLDRDGSDLHAITPDTLYLGCYQAWGPTGKIAFALGVLYTVAPDGTALQEVPMTEVSQGGFQNAVPWSPDGNSIAASDTYGTLYRFSLANNTSTNLHVKAAAANPWSPDGKFLAFRIDSTKMVDEVPITHVMVGVMKADGSGQRGVTPDSVFAWAPAWLPEP